MTSNPGATMRMLITYAISIPLAILVGYTLTEPLSYGTLGFFGLVALLLASPLAIKWHYPIMVFGLGCPAYVFFLKGNPPLWQVVTMLSLGLAIVERTLNSDRRFISVRSMTWPLLFTVAMAYMTAKLTGGIGLQSLGGGTGGGKKYIALFLGVAMYFALTSRPIPKTKRNLYIALLFLAGFPAFISDLFPVLPSPLNYVNLIFPPSASGAAGGNLGLGVARLGAFANTASVVVYYMLAKFGLRGIFLANRPGRPALFVLMLVLSLLGGFRTIVIAYAGVLIMLFFFERLYRTRLLMVFAFAGVAGVAMMVPFANKMPFTFQRALSFLPLNWDAQAKLDAEGSTMWRQRIWRDTWPKVPEYLLLGKGYALHAEDFAMMGHNQFAGGVGVQMDASREGLAVSGDYHNGPLSTLMPFGIWGAISYLWVTLAVLRVLRRNYQYGDPELKTVNRLLLVMAIYQVFGFFFIFGAYTSALGELAKLAGFSIALNWGVCGPNRDPAPALRIKPQPRPMAA